MTVALLNMKVGLFVNYLCMHSDADVDGDTLVELTEEQSAADFKDICPAIKQRVMSWRTTQVKYYLKYRNY